MEEPLSGRVGATPSLLPAATLAFSSPSTRPRRSRPHPASPPLVVTCRQRATAWIRPCRREKMRGEREGRRRERKREERGEGGGAGENGAEVSVEAAGVASFQLMYLAHEGNAEGVRKPLGAGADPNFRDSGARTVLHISSCEGHAEVVDLLLDRSAEAVVEDQWGSTINVLLHMELTECMKIMPSHIMLTKF